MMIVKNIQVTSDGYLKLISSGTEIIIGATDGKGTFVKEKKLSHGWFDPDFVNYNTNVKGQPTKEAPVHVYEVIKDGTFAQIFGGFGENLDRLCLSQDQIIRFVKDHCLLLCTDSYGTLFLFKVNGEFFVVHVYQFSSGLEGHVYRLSNYRICGAGKYQVVVPQL